MKIVLDLQSLETKSRFRGIGRYACDHARELVRQFPSDTFFCVFNDSNTDAIVDFHREFADDILPVDSIKIFSLPPRWDDYMQPDSSRRAVAEILRETFIASLNPDFVLIYSLMEHDRLVASINKYVTHVPTGMLAHDFIPYWDKNKYLPASRHAWYDSKIEDVRRADLILCNSTYTAEETLRIAPGLSGKVFSVSAATTDFWKPDASPWDAIGRESPAGIRPGFILYVGGLEERKNVTDLIDAYLLLPGEIREKHQLCIACGKNPHETKTLESYIRKKRLPDTQYLLLGFVSDDLLRALYSACHVFVFPSYAEGFGLPVLEALSCGAPVLSSESTSLPEVVGMESALFDPSDVKQLSSLLLKVCSDVGFRRELLEHALPQSRKFSWRTSARLAGTYIHNISTKKKSPENGEWEYYCIDMVRPYVDVDKEKDVPFLQAVAQCIADNFRPRRKEKYLFVDVSLLRMENARTGIQRVEEQILNRLWEYDGQDYRVYPIYSTPDAFGYAYASDFVQKYYSQCFNPELTGGIEYQAGDIYLCLELIEERIDIQKDFFQKMRAHGVKLVQFVHDLIPIYHPDTVSDGMQRYFPRWLDVITEFDGAVCNSRATADDLKTWMGENKPKKLKNYPIVWTHLGADFSGTLKSKGVPDCAQEVFAAMDARKSLLMVSTVEPRKAYAQALDACEELWAGGQDINLVIVGKPGWKSDDVIKRLSKHKELHSRLFWLQGVSDEYLSLLYEKATAVLMASLAEGFGLAVIEAAHYGKPLILRDIPVFREIAGDYAFYFSGMRGHDLAQAVGDWLLAYASGSVPDSREIAYLTWEQCARNVMDCVEVIGSEADNTSIAGRQVEDMEPTA